MLFDDVPGDARRQERTAVRHRPYPRDEFVRIAGLQQESGLTAAWFGTVPAVTFAGGP